jgi:alpha-beta hydrolase superfamily lysophospholipase
VSPSRAALTWHDDVLPGFEAATLEQPPSWDGVADATLVRRSTSLTGDLAVLYVHGWADYFFQRHLADFYEEQGIRFYAVDLRRHGRSLLPHQHPDTCRSLDEYLADLDAAIDVLVEQEGVRWLLVNGHSTGGLTAALHAHRGRHRGDVKAVFLNSPWLGFRNVRGIQGRGIPVLGALGRFLPDAEAPSTDTTYAECIHVSAHGEWDFDLAWKPMAGFPLRWAWIRAIREGHAEVAKGLSIEAPVLLLHSSRSLAPKGWSEEAMRADVVLEIQDMLDHGPGLGRRVDIEAVDDGMHDLVLSIPEARADTFRRLAAWLDRVRPS